MLSGTPAETPAQTTSESMPQFQPAPANSSNTPTHIGTWKATLSNNASISLDLQDDGSFTWSARNKEGQASEFQGRFKITDGALTLIRQDNQQLAGSLTINNSNRFTFKLNGAKDNGLDFQRS